MPARFTLLLPLLAALSLAQPAAQAQVYRWHDAQGRVQLGDRPPPGVQATQVGGKSATVAPPITEEASRQQAQEQRDQWARVLHRRSEPVEASPPPLAPPRHQGPPKGQATHEAPQGDCRRYQYLQGLIRQGGLHRCRGTACTKATPQEVEIIEREARLACGGR